MYTIGGLAPLLATRKRLHTRVAKQLEERWGLLRFVEAGGSRDWQKLGEVYLEVGLSEISRSWKK